MKNSIRNLAIVSACAVVLGGALTALLLTGNSEDGASSSSSTQNIELVSKKKEDVSSMKVTNGKGSFTLVPIKASTVLTSSAASASSGSSSSGDSSTPVDIEYTVKGLEGLPINTSATNSTVQNGFSLVATRNLGTVSSLEDYGLKDPEATVEVSFKDGSAYNYKIGKTTATDSSSRYMCGMDSDNVYIVSVDEGLLESATYFVSREILSIGDQNSKDDFTQIKLSGAKYPQGITIGKSGKELKITAPHEFEMDYTKMNNIKSALKSLSADSVEAVNPDTATISKYGLDNPSAVVEFTVNGKKYKLLAGAQKEDKTYVMLEGVNAIYSVSASSIQAWAAESLFSLKSHILFMPNIETVKSLTVTVGSTVNELNLTRTKDEKKSTEDTTYYTYKVAGTDGKILDYDKNYKNFYKNVISVYLLEDASQKPDGAPVLMLQYRYFDKAGTDKVELYKSGDRSYTAVVNDVVSGIVTQDDVDKITSSIQLLESGKSVPE